MRSPRYKLLHKRTHCKTGYLLFAKLTFITRGGLIFNLLSIPIWLTKTKEMPNTKKMNLECCVFSRSPEVLCRCLQRHVGRVNGGTRQRLWSRWLRTPIIGPLPFLSDREKMRIRSDVLLYMLLATIMRIGSKVELSKSGKPRSCTGIDRIDMPAAAVLGTQLTPEAPLATALARCNPRTPFVQTIRFEKLRTLYKIATDTVPLGVPMVLQMLFVGYLRIENPRSA